MDSDFMSNLSNMLNNGKIPDNLKNVVNNLKNNNTSDDKANNFNTDNNANAESTSNSSNSIDPEMLKNIMNMFNNSGSSNSNNPDSNTSSDENNSNFDINTLLKLKSVFDKVNSSKSDPRSNLLLSLKPYLKESRKSKVEQYIQLFNMTKFMDVFNQNGGEKTK